MQPNLTDLVDIFTIKQADGSVSLPQQWDFSKHYPFGPDRNATYAYFVWCWTRYYGGANTALPSSASQALGRDPNRTILLVLAKKIAKHVYGTCTAGPAHTASNWGIPLVTNSLN